MLSTRYPAATFALAAVAAALSGCAPAPDPSPTPTAMFATEEEAFAAAEEVYRAYNEAVNDERREDAGEDPRDFLIGLALEGDTDARRILKDKGLTISGDGEIAQFAPRTATVDLGATSLEVAVCLDVSGTTVLDSGGNDVTSPERQQRVPLLVTFDESNRELKISDSTAEDGATC